MESTGLPLGEELEKECRKRITFWDPAHRLELSLDKVLEKDAPLFRRINSCKTDIEEFTVWMR